MTGTVSGCGTKWIDGVFDEDDCRPRVATKWVVFVELPILPLQRAILDPLGTTTQRHVNRTEVTTRYRILQERWLHPLEIIFVYLWRWLVVGPVAVVGYIASLVGPMAGLMMFSKHVIPEELPFDFLGPIIAIAMFVLWLILTVAAFVVVTLLIFNLRKAEAFVLSLTDDASRHIPEA